MNKRFLRHLLSGILAVSVVLSGGFYSLSKSDSAGFTVLAEDELSDVSIDRASLQEGSTVSVLGAEGYSDVKIFIGDTEVPGDHVLSSDDLSKWVRVEGYVEGSEEPASSAQAYFSNLPVIYIDTENAAPIDSKEDYVSGTMDIQNNTGSSLAYSGKIEIRGRGNSTWEWPKKPYKIKLDKKADFFGKGANKHYVLLANYLDESLLRNTTASQISKKLGLPTMESEWTEVVLNGEYVGNYQLCEHVRIADGRVEVFDWENEAEDVAKAIYDKEKKTITKDKKTQFEDLVNEDLSWVTSGEVVFEGNTFKVSKYYDAMDDITGGYLFEMSDQYDEVSKFTTEHGLKVMLKSPEFLNTNDDMMDFVETYWQDLENAYRAEDGYTNTANGKKHYTELADLDSMVSYWLVMEIMGNDDAVWKSRFAYLAHGELLKYGPAWDFDMGCGSSYVSSSAQGWKVSKSEKDQAFFKEFTDDPLFISKATEKYWKIRPFIKELVTDGGYIETKTALLLASGNADQARWDRHETWPDAARGFENDAEMFRNYLTDRLAWLDDQFMTDDTLLNSLHTSLSASPYAKSEQIGITVEGASEDTASMHAPADYAVEQGDGVDLLVEVSDGSTKSLNVYVNGLEYGSTDVENGQAVIELPENVLYEELGKKNVISVIGKDEGGNTTGRNYVTVILKESTKPAFKGNNILLDGRIGVNFYVDLSTLTDEEREACYVEFTVSGQTKTDTFDASHKNVTGEYYGFTCYVSSVQMAETITAELHYGDGKTVTKEYSVLQYIETIDENSDKYDQETLDLVHAMADYGHYVQPFSASYNGWVVGEKYAAMDKHYAESYDYDEIREFTAEKALVTNYASPDIEKISYSLYPDSDTSIKIFIKLVSGYTGPVTAKINGEEAQAVLQADGRYLVVIPNLAAHRLGQTYDVVIETESGVNALSVSAMSYVNAVLNADVYQDNAVAKDAVSAIGKYYEAAMAYKAKEG